MSEHRERTTREELARRIQEEGALVAYEAALAVARDPKAPPAARATASATLFRVGGWFNKPAEDDDVPAHEMTPEQLNAATKRLQRQLDERSGPDVEPDIFA